MLLLVAFQVILELIHFNILQYFSINATSCCISGYAGTIIHFYILQCYKNYSDEVIMIHRFTPCLLVVMKKKNSDLFGCHDYQTYLNPQNHKTFVTQHSLCLKKAQFS